MRSTFSILGLAMIVVVPTWAAPARASIPDYDFQWVNIANTGNPGYDGPTIPGREWISGRGSVEYQYRISKLEITTAQWLEYVNTFTTQSNAMSFFIQAPFNWGAVSDLSYLGPGRKYTLKGDPNAPLFPVGGISWREAARYCNWLQNGKSANVASLTTGAYDTTTWGNGPTPGTFTDAPARLPGAQFFIPNFDEYIKAAHYDPNKSGSGVGGWWAYDNKSDSMGPVSGFPGSGTSSVGTGHWFIPLGAYPQTTSAYGLLDLSGGAREWLENYGYLEDFKQRMWDGASIDDGTTNADLAYRFGGDYPDASYISNGLRIASVPATNGAFALGVGLLIFSRRKRDELQGIGDVRTHWAFSRGNEQPGQHHHPVSSGRLNNKH